MPRLDRKRDGYHVRIRYNSQDYSHDSDLPLMLACNTPRLGRNRDEYPVRIRHNSQE